MWRSYIDNTHTEYTVEVSTPKRAGNAKMHKNEGMQNKNKNAKMKKSNVSMSHQSNLLQSQNQKSQEKEDGDERRERVSLVQSTNSP